MCRGVGDFSGIAHDADLFLAKRELPASSDLRGRYVDPPDGPFIDPVECDRVRRFRDPCSQAAREQPDDPLTHVRTAHYPMS